jgi:hypothetical protein
MDGHPTPDLGRDSTKELLPGSSPKKGPWGALETRGLGVCDQGLAVLESGADQGVGHRRENMYTGRVSPVVGGYEIGKVNPTESPILAL